MPSISIFRNGWKWSVGTVMIDSGNGGAGRRTWLVFAVWPWITHNLSWYGIRPYSVRSCQLTIWARARQFFKQKRLHWCRRRQCHIRPEDRIGRRNYVWPVILKSVRQRGQKVNQILSQFVTGDRKLTSSYVSSSMGTESWPVLCMMGSFF